MCSDVSTSKDVSCDYYPLTMFLLSMISLYVVDDVTTPDRTFLLVVMALDAGKTWNRLHDHLSDTKSES